VASTGRTSPIGPSTGAAYRAGPPAGRARPGLIAVREQDHKKDFQWLVLEKLGHDDANNVDWSAPRLICVAGDFTRYDDHAVKQIQRNIELIRYRRFGQDLLLLDLASASTAGPGVLKTAWSGEPGGAVSKKTTI
jgi:hypothetical protein